MAVESDPRNVAGAVAQDAPEPILAFDRELRCQFVNRAAACHFGSTSADLQGLRVEAIFASVESCHEVVDSVAAALGGAATSLRCWGSDADSMRTCYDLVIAPLNVEGSITGATIHIRDVTQQVKAEERARLAVIMFEHTTEGLMIFGADHRIRLVNPAFTLHTGYQASEAIGNTADLFVAAGSDTAPYTDAWQALEYDTTWEGEIIYRRRDGRLLATWQTIVRVGDAGGDTSLYLAVFTDLTERQRYEQQLERLVYYDVLTGMPNRALLADRTAQAIARAERFGYHLALLFVDLDRFKVVNDTLGNNAGDQLLREVANRITTVASPGDTASRYGADQFVLLLPEIDTPDQAATLARQLLTQLSRPHPVNEQTLTITASVGISVYPEDGEERETLLHHAETAMQAAKRAGRNTFRFFTQDMNQRSAEYLLLESYLRHGLANDEFLLYYQPQIDLKTREIIGFEALMRWEHPELGMVQPNRFIPAAEESGLIVPMGQWALQEACRQNKAWQRLGLISVPVAVNVSGLQFAEALDEVIADALEAADLAPEWLEVEVTESTLMGSVHEAIHILNTLKQMGVRLAIDDFGTGYSSLSYLKRFPLDKLKVDRSFITDILIDSDDAAIASAVISLAKNLRLKVIAEGVETQQQVDFLNTLGCDEFQGFLVSPALPAAAIPAFLDRYKAGQARTDQSSA